MCLSPEPPASDSGRLYNFYRSTNFSSAKNDFQHRILSTSSPFSLPKEEADAWVEIFHAYWKAIGEILNAETATRTNGKVSNDLFLKSKDI